MPQGVKRLQVGSTSFHFILTVVWLCTCASSARDAEVSEHAPCTPLVFDPQEGATYFVPTGLSAGLHAMTIAWNMDCAGEAKAVAVDINHKRFLEQELEGFENGLALVLTGDLERDYKLRDGMNRFDMHVLGKEGLAGRVLSRFHAVLMDPETQFLLTNLTQKTKTQFGVFHAPPLEYVDTVASLVSAARTPDFAYSPYTLYELPWDSALVAKVIDVSGKLLSQHEMRAYVVNVPSSTRRWAAVSEELSVLPVFKPYKWSAVPLDDARIRGSYAELAGHPQSLSLTLSFLEAWTHFAESTDFKEADWALFLEDDAQWHPALAGKPEAVEWALQAGLAAAADDGFAYLGVCNPTWVADQFQGRQVLLGTPQRLSAIAGRSEEGERTGWQEDGASLRVVLARGAGLCAHAYALTRWQARELAGWMRRTLAREGLLGPAAQQPVPHVSRHVVDILLRDWARERGDSGRGDRVVIGADLQSPESMFGVMRQNRAEFPQSERDLLAEA